VSVTQSVASRERLFKVLLAPHISEKSSLAADNGNRVVFRVLKDATKVEIKAAIELLFEVDVQGVSVATMKGKVKRSGRTNGKRSDWKKAYVRLAEGQDIDFVGAE